MTKFRKGDVVTIQGTIDTGFIHDGKVKLRVEPYSDVYANVSDIKMVRPVIEVGDSVTYPAHGYASGEVLAIIDGYCWVKLVGTAKMFSPPGEDIADDMRVSWPIACLNRVDPDLVIEPLESEIDTLEAAPVEDAA